MTVFSCSHLLFPKSRDISKRLPEAAGRRIYVYQLRDTLSAAPFYIGKGTGNRPWVHFKDTGDSAKARHIRKLLASKSVIMVDILSFFDCHSSAFRLEKSLIAKYGRSDNGTGILYNLTDGGDTGPSTKGMKMYRNEVSGAIKFFKHEPDSTWVKHNAIKGKICVLEEGRKRFIDPEEYDPDKHQKTGVLTGYRTYVNSNDEIIKLPETSPPPPGYTRASAVSGKIAITNGEITKYVYREEQMPPSFAIGRHFVPQCALTHVTNGNNTIAIPAGGERPAGYKHFNEGQVYITDGVSKKKLAAGEPIPDGWRIGSPHRAMLGRRKITDGAETRWLGAGEQVPNGWKYCCEARSKLSASQLPLCD